MIKKYISDIIYNEQELSYEPKLLQDFKVSMTTNIETNENGIPLESTCIVNVDTTESTHNLIKEIYEEYNG